MVVAEKASQTTLKTISMSFHHNTLDSDDQVQISLTIILLFLCGHMSNFLTFLTLFQAGRVLESLETENNI